MSSPRFVRMMATVSATALTLGLGLTAPATAQVTPGSITPGPITPGFTTAGSLTPSTLTADGDAPAPKFDRTSVVEARRVDRVKAPKLTWKTCGTKVQCASVKLPLDYDQPKGATVKIGLVRVKARVASKRIGTLFVNPGGPGGSSTDLARSASRVFGPAILDRFDVVGIDPRGVNTSAQVKCFTSTAAQNTVLSKLSGGFPYGAAAEKRWVQGSEAFGKACSRTGKPLTASVSTAEVARDMDVLRRAVGDKKLTYIGFSYGTYLGQVYANLFPDRVRAMTIDGVLEPRAWAGTKANRTQPQTDRLRSADGATKALKEILVRCDKAGKARCSFAAGNPVANFDLVAERLKKRPLALRDPQTGETFRFGYPDLISLVLGLLYDPAGSNDIASVMSELIVITSPASSASRDGRERAAAGERRVSALITDHKDDVTPGRFATYDNSAESFTSVLCTDSVNPTKASAWVKAAAAADKRATYFGRAWIWSSAPCASSTWTVKDEDAYRGSFTHRTFAPVLVVGNTYDPATNYASAVAVSKLLPNSRLLSSKSWGHTAYGTSRCTTNAVDGYLIDLKVPAKGKTCTGDVQPFAK